MATPEERKLVRDVLEHMGVVQAPILPAVVLDAIWESNELNPGRPLLENAEGYLNVWLKYKEVG